MIMLFHSVLVHAEAEYPLAPEWDVSEWMKGEPLHLEDLRGKVVVIEFFQLWCPGCNRFSIPLMLEWEKKYRGNKDVRMISIHTVFEGHDYQTPDRLRKFIRKKGIKHSVGIDAYKEGSRLPNTMLSYKTRGTPEMAIIDKMGRIRFQHFGSFDQKVAEDLIDKLLEE